MNGLQRIIFVGVHNKPGMRPLDSKTKSGKLIDRIAEEVYSKSREIKRTNLFDVDYFPKRYEIDGLVLDFIERVELTQHDCVVLLGAYVHKHFPKLLLKTIKLPHPSSQWSHEDMNSYVKRAVREIEASLTVIQSN